MGVPPRVAASRKNVAFFGPLDSRIRNEQTVFWAFIAVIALTLLTITLTNRGIVRIIGAVLLAGLLVFGLVLRLGNETGPDPEGMRGKPSSPAATVTAIALDDIEVDQLKLAGGGAPFELRGHVQNLSDDTHIRSLTLRMTRRDCYEGALDPSGCMVVWQDQHWIALNVPPKSARDFATSFYARTPVSRLQGTVKDEFKLIAATGQPAEQ